MNRELSSKGFLAFLTREAEHQRQNGNIGVADNYSSSGRSFHRFLLTKGKKDISLQKMTALLVSDYEAWLKNNGLCRNTTSFYARCLQSIYNKAVQRGLTEDRKPFQNVYRGVAKTVKRAIRPTEIYRLSNLDIRSALIRKGGKADSRRLTRHQSNLEFARDLFVFCFCARGMAFIDLAFMRKSDITNGVITYVRRKTKQKMEVRVEPMMQQIIDRYPSDTAYLLPILTQTGDSKKVYQQYRYAITRYNISLHLLGEMLGNIRLTSYVSRHTWATTAQSQNVPLSIISQSMGHDSEKTTEIYLKSLEENLIHQTNSELLEHVFQPCTDDKKNVKKEFLYLIYRDVLPRLPLAFQPKFTLHRIGCRIADELTS